MISFIEIIDWLSRSLYLWWSRFSSMIFFSFLFPLFSYLFTPFDCFVVSFSLHLSWHFSLFLFPYYYNYIITIFLFLFINSSYLIKNWPSINYGTYITFLQELIYSRFKSVNSVHSNYISSVVFTFYSYVRTSV